MKPSTSQRGYGYDHQRLRDRLKPFVEAGMVRCARCGRLIEPCTPFDLGHVDGSGRTLYQGIEHRTCNRRAGGKIGAAITNGGKQRRVSTGLRVSRVW